MLLPIYCWFGLAALAIIVGGVLLSLEGFSGMKQERYSPLNHFISELGDNRFAKHHHMFNISLFVGGIVFIPFDIGIASLVINPFFFAIVLIIGLISAISCSLVGIFPEQKEKIHFIVAGFFFVGMDILMLLVIIGTFLQVFFMFPIWIAVLSIFTLAVSLAFIIDTVKLPKWELERTYKPWAWDPDPRPSFWMNPFLEWCSFIALGIWLLTIVIFSFS